MERHSRQVFELAKSIADVVSSARALRSEDLVLPQDVPATPNPAPPDTRAASALADFKTKLANLSGALTPTDIRKALQEASLYGIGESYPFIDDASLPDQATGIANEMQRRVTAATAPGQTDAAVMAALFGKDFLFCRGSSYRRPLLQSSTWR